MRVTRRGFMGLALGGVAAAAGVQRSGLFRNNEQGRCQEFRPDHNGECLNCDEWADAHEGPIGPFTLAQLGEGYDHFVASFGRQPERLLVNEAGWKHYCALLDAREAEEQEATCRLLELHPDYRWVTVHASFRDVPLQVQPDRDLCYPTFVPAYWDGFHLPGSCVFLSPQHGWLVVSA